MQDEKEFLKSFLKSVELKSALSEAVNDYLDNMALEEGEEGEKPEESEEVEGE